MDVHFVLDLLLIIGALVVASVVIVLGVEVVVVVVELVVRFCVLSPSLLLSLRFSSSSKKC